MAKSHRGQLSSVGGGDMLGGGAPLGSESSSPPSPTKRTPDSASKKCDSGLKSDLGNFTTKLKIEPGESVDSPHDCGLANGITDQELTARRLAHLSDSEHLSPRKEGMGVPAHYDKYGLVSKEECLPGHPGHGHPVSMAMSLEPNLHHLTDPNVSCNNFTVDSIMTTGSRDGSPQPGAGVGHPGGGDQVSGAMSGYRGAPWGGNSPTYPTCLYPGPGQTSLEELSSMTAACLSSQTQMSSLYSRPSWYTMPAPGHHSPSNIVNNPDQSFPQREYFEPLGKAPSPIQSGCSGDQVPYRSPSYRTNYYSQDCEKY